MTGSPGRRSRTYSTLYALAALEPSRAQVQVLHEQDNICFHGCGRHDRIREYGDRVRGAARGAFETAVTVGNVPEVNGRDRTILRAGRVKAHGRRFAGLRVEPPLQHAARVVSLCRVCRKRRSRATFGRRAMKAL